MHGLAYFAGSLALAVILFDSGFGTPLNALRQAAGPALSLATVGVLLTAGLFGAAAYYCSISPGWNPSCSVPSSPRPMPPRCSSCCASASINLRDTRALDARGRIRHQRPDRHLPDHHAGRDHRRPRHPEINVLVTILAWLPAQMGLGAVVGVLGGMMIVRLVDRLESDHGLLPIFVLTLSLMVFAAAGAIGGSGFLAVYVAGLIAGNSDIRAVTILKRFQDGMSWLAQIIMFLILGLLATPSQFPAIAVPAVLLGLFLIFVARPARRLALPDPVPPARSPRSPSSPGSACAAPSRSCSPSRRCSAAWKTAASSSTPPSSSCWCRWSCRAGRSGRWRAGSA